MVRPNKKRNMERCISLISDLSPLGKENKADEVNTVMDKRSLEEGDWKCQKKMEEPVGRGNTATAVNAHYNIYQLIFEQFT